MTKIEVFEIVKKNIVYILPDVEPSMIQIEQQLKELGANSIDRMEIVVMSLEDLDLKVPLVELGSVSTIEGLVNFLYEKKIAG